ncbi:protoglobin domain-containing protein [Nitratifractor salsuginis]|uniref:Globin-sensor domain-containing protein n=1 Tax=Nitratifractor salsuginis (strain DSM 16511 / JCM 12458 / E9I37-1) TaxID=749222 RepID=E6X116_NITSE|nr:protoglobin domain-containing protein [Nitratifractor salsuginis]ADV45819.1 hypothetical protein Nitsa_0550 [Nitratifractor salsuginis DSM 16511]
MDKLTLIKEIYDLDENDLKMRKEALEKLAPYAGEIMDRFYEKLLEKEELASFIPRERIPELKKKQIAFVAELLSKPFDDKLYRHIARVGIVHYHIRLDPISMSYGFHLLSQLILAQSQRDPGLLPYLKLVIKYLKVAEAIMGQEYFAQKTLEKTPYRANDLFLAVNELYARYSLCRQRVRQIASGEEQKIDPKQSAAFREALDKLAPYRQILEAIGLKLSIVKRHCTELEQARSPEEAARAAELLDESILHPLNDLSVSAYMTLGSSLASLRAMTDILYRRSTAKEAAISAEEARRNIRGILENTYGWAIESLEFLDEEPEEEAWDIVKHLYLPAEERILYLALRLKSLSNRIYIAEGLDLLGEAMKLTLFLTGKELKS